VGGFQYLLVSGQRQTGFDQARTGFFVLVKGDEQEIDVGL